MERSPYHQHDSYLRVVQPQVVRVPDNLFGHDVQAKSRTLQWPSVPVAYERDFIRASATVMGTWALTIEAVCRFASTAVQRCSRRPPIQDYRTDRDRGHHVTGNHDVHLIIYCGIKAVCLAQWLYQDGDLALDRKQKVAQELADGNKIGSTRTA